VIASPGLQQQAMLESTLRFWSKEGIPKLVC